MRARFGVFGSSSGSFSPVSVPSRSAPRANAFAVFTRGTAPGPLPVPGVRGFPLALEAARVPGARGRARQVRRLGVEPGLFPPGLGPEPQRAAGERLRRLHARHGTRLDVLGERAERGGG